MTILPKYTDEELFHEIAGLIKPNSTGLCKRLLANTKNNCHAVAWKSAKKVEGVVSGTTKFSFSIEKKKQGFLLVIKTYHGADQQTARRLIERLLEKSMDEAKRFKEIQESNTGIKVKIAKGFSVRKQNNFPAALQITNEESERNFSVAKASGYFHEAFIKGAKKVNGKCFFKG